MLTKEKFIKMINEFKVLEEDIKNVHIALQKLDPDFGGFYLSRVNTLIVNLFKEAMNDKYDYINYFIYELEYGKKWKKGMIIEENKKKDIKLQTSGDLYDYIVNIE